MSLQDFDNANNSNPPQDNKITSPTRGRFIINYIALAEAFKEFDKINQKYKNSKKAGKQYYGKKLSKQKKATLKLSEQLGKDMDELKGAGVDVDELMEKANKILKGASA